jgi:hypothetical protein
MVRKKWYVYDVVLTRNSLMQHSKTFTPSEKLEVSVRWSAKLQSAEARQINAAKRVEKPIYDPRHMLVINRQSPQVQFARRRGDRRTGCNDVRFLEQNLLDPTPVV